MSTELAVKNPLTAMAQRLEINADEMKAVIMATVMPAGGKGVTAEQFTAFVAVANNYGLDPLKREIYAFPAKGGGIQPVVGIDGWLSIIHSHPDFDGMELKENFENGSIYSTTCTIYRKSASHPTVITEYLEECRRNTDPWKKPIRMMRHKATIQAARYAFGLSGIMEQDEAENAIASERDITPAAAPVSAMRRPEPPAAVRLVETPAEQPAEPQEPAPHPEFENVAAYINSCTNIEALDAGGANIKKIDFSDKENIALRRMFSSKKAQLIQGDTA